ncbi:MAG TPA: hypothetical protein VJ179_01575 [Patescibacteria group bacterium]|nr:hypothetical protein [Patescibacteria group bacterium]
MRKLPIVFLLVTLLFLSSQTFVFAQSTTYTKYRSYIDQYRDTKESFVLARTKHKNFQSLTTQTSLVEASVDFFGLRISILSAYLDVLQEKIDEEPALTQEEKDVQKKTIEEQKKLLDQHRQKIETLQRVEQINTVSKEFDELYKVISANSQSVRTHVYIGRAKQVFQQFTSTTQKLEEKTNSLQEQGKNVNLLESWLSRMKEKTSAVDQSLKEAASLATVTSNPDGTLSNVKLASTHLELVQENLEKISLFFKEFVQELRRVK